MEDSTLLGIVGTLQVMSTAWLHYFLDKKTKNYCKSDECREAIIDIVQSKV